MEATKRSASSFRIVSIIFAVLSTIVIAIVELGIKGTEADIFQTGSVIEVKNSTVQDLDSEVLGKYRVF